MNNYPQMTSFHGAQNPSAYHPHPNHPLQMSKPFYSQPAPSHHDSFQRPYSPNNIQAQPNRPKKKIFPSAHPEDHSNGMRSLEQSRYSPIDFNQSSFSHQSDFRGTPTSNYHSNPNPQTSYHSGNQYNSYVHTPYNMQGQSQSYPQHPDQNDYNSYENHPSHYNEHRSQNMYNAYPPMNQRQNWEAHPQVMMNTGSQVYSEPNYMVNNSFPSERVEQYNSVTNSLYPTQAYDRDMFHSDQDSISVHSTASSKRRIKPIVIMNINIGNGKMDEIRVFKGDNPSEVARAFCEKYNLPSTLHPVLVQNLTAKIDEYYIKEAEQTHSTIDPRDLMIQQSNQSGYSQRDAGPSSNQRGNYGGNPNYITQPPVSTATTGRNTVEQAHIKNNSYPERANREASRSPVAWQEASNIRSANRKESLNSIGQPNHKQKGDQVEEYEEVDLNDSGISSQAAFDRLYQQGMKKMQQREMKTKEVQQRREKQELQDVTFRPKVSKASKAVAERVKPGRVEDDSVREAARKAEKIEKAKLIRERLELEGCIFQPDISSNTKRTTPTRIDRSRSRSPIHDRLYKQTPTSRDRDKEKISKEINKSYTFTPKVNPESTAIIEKKRLKAAQEKQTQEDSNAHQRLYRESVARNKSYNAKSEELSPSFDPKTGQELYKPHINKHNEFYEKAATRSDAKFVEEHVEVEEDLFNKIRDTRSSKNIKFKEEPKSKVNTPQKSVSPGKSRFVPKSPSKNSSVTTLNPLNSDLKTSKSNIAYPLTGDTDSDRKKALRGFNNSILSLDNHESSRPRARESDREMLMDIFQKLDSDGNGKISMQDIDISGLDSDVLEIIQDIILALEEDVVMNFEDFIYMIYSKTNIINQLREVHGITSDNYRKVDYIVSLIGL